MLLPSGQDDSPVSDSPDDDQAAPAPQRHKGVACTVQHSSLPSKSDFDSIQYMISVYGRLNIFDDDRLRHFLLTPLPPAAPVELHSTLDYVYRADPAEPPVTSPTHDAPSSVCYIVPQDGSLYALSTTFCGSPRFKQQHSGPCELSSDPTRSHVDLKRSASYSTQD
jgi:hypothetical protein